jgi:uncharacterized membrane protein
VSRDRLEAFSDGVIAVVITIGVLNLRPPAGDALTDLWPVAPKLAIYCDGGERVDSGRRLGGQLR